MKNYLLLAGIILLNIGFCNGQFNNSTYLANLQKYWNYRYHLLGDNIITDQHVPWEPDYVHKLGEPGMLVVGSAAGNSVPATGIEMYDIYGYNTSATYYQSCWEVIDPYKTLPLTQLAFGPNPGPDPFFGTVNVPSHGTQTNPCQSQIDELFNEVNLKSGIVIFDDQVPTLLAVYIEVLATEWLILNNAGQSTIATESELALALNALIRFDTYSADKYPTES